MGDYHSNETREEFLPPTSFSPQHSVEVKTSDSSQGNVKSVRSEKTDPAKVSSQAGVEIENVLFEGKPEPDHGGEHHSLDIAFPLYRPDRSGKETDQFQRFLA